MTNKRRIFKWVIIIVSLFAFQTLTYLTLGPGLLKNKLLPDYFATLTHHSDSVFIRDFYVSDCYTGDNNIYTSHNLRKDEKALKKKFNVDYVYFDSQQNFSWSDTMQNQFNLTYKTWTSRPNWLTIFGWFGARQTETLQTDKKYFYKREATYHWILFFWIKTFEWFESSDISQQKIK